MVVAESSRDPLAVSQPACLSTGILVADHLCSPIDHVPRAGELLLADELPLAIGGCAANVAMGLARLGVDVGVAGCVGRDAFGQFIKQTLSADGIGVSLIREVDDVGTSGTLIINVEGEDRRFIHTVGANGVFRVEDIPLKHALGVKVFYVGGYLLMPNFDSQALAGIFRQARAAGVKTGLISNSWGHRTYDRDELGRLFDGLVISGEEGMRKPDPEIYALGAERIGLEPADCVFVDDLPGNLKPARTLGMATVHHKRAEETIPQLEELLAVPLRQ